jgi:hypothetical protein
VWFFRGLKPYRKALILKDDGKVKNIIHFQEVSQTDCIKKIITKNNEQIKVTPSGM